MTRSRRAAVLVAGALVVAGIVALAWWVIDDTDDAASSGAVVSDVVDARKPFTGLTAGTVSVGGQPVSVVVADSLDERIQGLRGRPHPGPYAGMLFVFPGDTTTAFTMSGVPEPLEIAFFDAEGRRVEELRMEPCEGSDVSCPAYRSADAFRYALETAPGEMPAGNLRVPG